MTDPKDMNNLMIMLSGMCERDDLITFIQNAIDDYKNDPVQNTWARLVAVCSMLLMKEIQLEKGGEEDPISASLKVMKEMREFDDMMKLFKPNEQ